MLTKCYHQSNSIILTEIGNRPIRGVNYQIVTEIYGSRLCLSANGWTIRMKFFSVLLFSIIFLSFFPLDNSFLISILLSFSFSVLSSLFLYISNYKLTSERATITISKLYIYFIFPCIYFLLFPNFVSDFASISW